MSYETFKSQVGKTGITTHDYDSPKNNPDRNKPNEKKKTSPHKDPIKTIAKQKRQQTGPIPPK